MITWALLFTARVNYNDFLQRNCDPIYFDRSSRIQRIERINDLRNPKSTGIVIIRPIYTVGQKKHATGYSFLFHDVRLSRIYSTLSGVRSDNIV